MVLKLTRTTPIPLTHSGTSANILPVEELFQAQTNWCWAACCEMLFKFFHFRNDSQCEIAGVVFPSEDCCADASPCNQPQLASVVFRDHFDFPFQPNNGPLTEAEIHNEIAAGRPVQVLWMWHGQSSGHLVLVMGEYATGDLEIIDPRSGYGQAHVSYEEVLEAQGEGDWTYSYYELNEA